MNKNQYCVIMAGGVGSRFWPCSRENNPKQFLDFFGTGQSLLQTTFNRIKQIVPTENIYIVTNEMYMDMILKQIPVLNKEQILLEPLRRNTAPCIAYATYKIYSSNPHANILVVPSDHLITNEAEFIHVINKGFRFTQNNNYLLTIGLKPSRPETGYGYIQVGAGGDELRKVKTFTEKPNLEMAKIFLKSGEFYWNSGMFIWSAEAILKEFKNLLPEISNQFESIKNDYFTDKEQEKIDAIYPLCQNISIDYGILEKAQNVYVILADFGWSDLGTWSSLHDISPKDENNNAVLKCNSMLYDCENNIVSLDKDKLIVMSGLKDYLVAEENNVLLICRKDEEKKIRQYVQDASEKFKGKYN